MTADPYSPASIARAVERHDEEVEAELPTEDPAPHGRHIACAAPIEEPEPVGEYGDLDALRVARGAK